MLKKPVSVDSLTCFNGETSLANDYIEQEEEACVCLVYGCMLLVEFKS